MPLRQADSSERQRTAVLRPAVKAASFLAKPLHIGLLSNLHCVIDLDAKIQHGAFEFRVSEEKLNGSKIFGPCAENYFYRYCHHVHHRR